MVEGGSVGSAGRSGCVRSGSLGSGGTKRSWLAAFAILSACFGGSIYVPVAAQATEAGAAAGAVSAQAAGEIVQRSFTFAIAGQKLSAALVQYTAVTGVDLVFDGEIADKLQSPGATGAMTAEQALRRLLAGTGLGYRFSSASTVTLYDPARGKGGSGSVTLDPIRVEGEGETAWGPVEGYTAHRSATGTKTDTPIIDTPGSIKVVPRAVLEDRQVIRIEDALKNVSGVNYSASVEQMSVSSRGFGAQVMEDGISRSTFSGGSTQDADLDPYKIERVEVLKGPASMLYGRGNQIGRAHV